MMLSTTLHVSVKLCQWVSVCIASLKVLKTFLRAAIPLTKLDAFRDLLKENAVTVPIIFE